MNTIIKIVSLVLITSLSLGFLGGCVGLFSSYEEPEYQVVQKLDSFEVREYETKLIASTQVRGNREEAASKAFRKLFRYISGDNTTSSKIAMTAPVTQETTGRKIEMTIPVEQSVGNKEGTWKVSFVMPSEFQLSTLPKPSDKSVSLEQAPSKKVAVVRFSGRWSDSNMREHREALSTFLEQAELTAIGDFTYAFYDAPFTLPMFRRNEVMIEIE